MPTFNPITAISKTDQNKKLPYHASTFVNNVKGITNPSKIKKPIAVTKAMPFFSTVPPHFLRGAIPVPPLSQSHEPPLFN